MAKTPLAQWKKQPYMAPSVATRLKPNALARLDRLSKQSGSSKCELIRELLRRAWQAEFGEEMEAPLSD